MDLIPGLPNDVVSECLIRVPYDQLSSVASVCRAWKAEIDLPEFFRRRRAAGYSRSIVAVAQERVGPTRTPCASMFTATPFCRLTLCDPETGNWHELPPVPGFAEGLPVFCQLAGVGSDLVVMGGWHPKSLEVSKAVFIYNFVSATWRRGADMPGCRRLFFACASDSDRMVFVAGGHDDDKKVLRSAMAYEVEKDEWIPLPDMAKERDECKAVFHRGKFHVIGGYCSELLGRLERSAEVFDAVTWHWDEPLVDFLDANTSPRTCVDGEDGKTYMCRASDVMALENATWQTVAKLPDGIHCPACVSKWQGELLVFGCAKLGQPHVAYVLNLKSYTWTEVAIPAEYSGHVQSASCLEI